VSDTRQTPRELSRGHSCRFETTLSAGFQHLPLYTALALALLS